MLSGGTSISFLNALGCFLAAPESVLLLRSTALTRPAIKLALGGTDCRITSGCASTRSSPALRAAAEGRIRDSMRESSWRQCVSRLSSAATSFRNASLSGAR
jgi:hypothetical protein